MKRLPLLMLTGLLLVGCAPALTSSQSVLDPFGGGFGRIGKAPAIWFSAGNQDIFGLVITINGQNMRANAPDYCGVEGAAIKCTVPTLVAGQNFVLPIKGSNLSAVATYKRGDGLSYNSISRQ